MGIQLDGINNEIKSQTKIDFPGSVGVAGTLTYEDVTNVDSIGIVTARTGVIVGSGVTLNATGVIATGIITATSFSGSGANLTGITGTTINNNADNRLITGSGTANTLNANSDLLWNGSRLDIDTGGTADALRIGNSAGTDTFIRLGSIDTNTDTHAVIKYDKDDNNLSLLISGESHGSGGIRILNGGDVETDDIFPFTNNSRDLGSTSKRWRNVYTNDLNLSNKGSTNSVDNTWGDYTIQEGENDLYLINNRNGKKYKFNLTEVY